MRRVRIGLVVSPLWSPIHHSMVAMVPVVLVHMALVHWLSMHWVVPVGWPMGWPVGWSGLVDWSDWVVAAWVGWVAWVHALLAVGTVGMHIVMVEALLEVWWHGVVAWLVVAWLGRVHVLAVSHVGVWLSVADLVHVELLGGVVLGDSLVVSDAKGDVVVELLSLALGWLDELLVVSGEKVVGHLVDEEGLAILFSVLLLLCWRVVSEIVDLGHLHRFLKALHLTLGLDVVDVSLLAIGHIVSVDLLGLVWLHDLLRQNVHALSTVSILQALLLLLLLSWVALSHQMDLLLLLFLELLDPLLLCALFEFLAG